MSRQCWQWPRRAISQAKLARIMAAPDDDDADFNLLIKARRLALLEPGLTRPKWLFDSSPALNDTRRYKLKFFIEAAAEDIKLGRQIAEIEALIRAQEAAAPLVNDDIDQRGAIRRDRGYVGQAGPPPDPEKGIAPDDGNRGRGNALAQSVLHAMQQTNTPTAPDLKAGISGNGRARPKRGRR